jgi:hypothetical protein
MQTQKLNCDKSPRPPHYPVSDYAGRPLGKYPPHRPAVPSGAEPGGEPSGEPIVDADPADLPKVVPALLSSPVLSGWSEMFLAAGGSLP